MSRFGPLLKRPFMLSPASLDMKTNILQSLLVKPILDILSFGQMPLTTFLLIYFSPATLATWLCSEWIRHQASGSLHVLFSSASLNSELSHCHIPSLSQSHICSLSLGSSPHSHLPTQANMGTVTCNMKVRKGETGSFDMVPTPALGSHNARTCVCDKQALS